MKAYKFKINGNNYDVVINSVSGQTADVTVNGSSYKVEMENGQVAQVLPSVSSTPSTASTSSAPVQTSAAAPAPAAQAAPASGSGEVVKSPLPGVIINISVKVGDKVTEGQEVAVLEAMKMENSIEAGVAGTVTAIHTDKGASVLEGAPIITIG